MKHLSKEKIRKFIFSKNKTGKDIRISSYLYETYNEMLSKGYTDQQMSIIVSNALDLMREGKRVTLFPRDLLNGKSALNRCKHMIKNKSPKQKRK